MSLLLLHDEEIPKEIIEEQESDNLIKSKQNNGKNEVTLNLFFSFDIVNSTKYKNLTPRWPIILKELLEKIKVSVEKSKLKCTSLWRIIGDEIVFVQEIYKIKDLSVFIEEIFNITQKIVESLREGYFFDDLEVHIIPKDEINMLKFNTLLSIKSTAWLAAINDEMGNPYDSIILDYSNGGRIIRDYIGKDIDAGFRLKNYTQDRRLIISFEIAYLLSKIEESSRLNIIDFVNLKGVWNDSLYPIIWYHKTNKNNEENNISFRKSFRYDEVITNHIKKNGFYKENIFKYKLLKDIFDINDLCEILEKILVDRNLEKKIDYFKYLLDKENINNGYKNPKIVYPEALILHCAVVCCDINDGEIKILIAKRNNNHVTNKGKWEFGCAKATSTTRLIDTVEKYYYNKFNVKIKVILDEERKDKQPIPIATYEIIKNSSSGKSIEKGIIFVGKVIKNFNEDERITDSSHDIIRWITEKDINNDEYKKENTVPDFQDTLKKVFKRAKEFFPNKKEDVDE